ncbi:MAG: signal peptidase I [Bacteroidetes bacterium GWE2_29_8]|nr:MAG: signal peptidase I [Bacteroidetes bacterium GWE2_29_8]OFY15386.1 MAG: signal peptidase I [Bacteroidetes bacterium GWF2_29_10]
MRNSFKILFFLKSIFVSILIIYLIKTFVYATFYVSDDFMEDTIFNGDLLLINRNIHNLNNNDVITYLYPLDTGYTNKQRPKLLGRCIGIPGDKLSISKSKILVNDKVLPDNETKKYNYKIITNKPYINYFIFQNLNINSLKQVNENEYIIATNVKTLDYLTKFDFITEATLDCTDKGIYDEMIFPSSPFIHNNIDNLNLLQIPKIGDTIQLTRFNIPLFYQIITFYEKNSFKIIRKKIHINGRKTNFYVFRNNYYYIIADNWHNSFDSRYFGLVPEKYIQGKVSMVIASVDKHTKWYNAIRFNRFFKPIK